MIAPLVSVTKAAATYRRHEFLRADALAGLPRATWASGDAHGRVRDQRRLLTAHDLLSITAKTYAKN
jgi:hypothetical protein